MLSSSAIRAGEYNDITVHNHRARNFNNKVHAFVRYSDEEKLLILTSFNDTDQNIKVQIPKQVLELMGLDDTADYIARDLLWREAEVGFNKDFTFELRCKPFSSFIFKIK